MYPVEASIAARGVDRPGGDRRPRAKARAAGFAQLNMPADLGGRDLSMLAQVALEEESGKATNGLGFAVVDRGPRELLALATRAGRALRDAGRARRAPRGVGADGARRGIGPRGHPGDGGPQRGRLAAERREVVRHERRGAGLLHRACRRRGRADPLPGRPGCSGPSNQAHSGFLHDPYLDHHPEIVFEDRRVPEQNRVPSGGNDGAKDWILVERLFIAARCCGAAQRLIDVATEYAKERVAFGSPIAEFQGVVPAGRLVAEQLAARLLTYHAAHAFDTLEDRSVVHGKVSIAKLYASEMAGRVADRAVQVLGGRGYMTDSPAARFYREVRVDRIWEGTSEIQRLILARGLLKRGAAPYLS